MRVRNWVRAVAVAGFVGSLLATAAPAGAQSGDIAFRFETYAKNVRVGEGLTNDFQLGTSTLRGEGTISADGRLVSGGTIFDEDTPLPNTSFRRRTMTLQVLSGTLSEAGTAKTLTLRVRVASQDDSRDCPVGAVATLTLVDNEARISNGQGSDSVVLGKYDSFCGHDHGWTNADRTISDPLSGGPGGGNYANVVIGGGATGGGGGCSGAASTLPRPAFGSPEPAAVTCMTLQGGQRNVRAGQEVYVPVYMINGANVANINYEITYNATVATAQPDVKRGSFFATSLGQNNTAQTGIVRVGNAQTGGENGTGSVSWIRFRAAGRPGDRTDLKITVSTINDPAGATLRIDRIDGLIQIVDENGLLPGDCPTAANGRLDLDDALCALQMSVQLIPISLTMDMDKDGNVTSRDSTIIQQRVATKLAQP